jgi:voltage-gated sodium channel
MTRALRTAVRTHVESAWFQNSVVALVVVNAVTLGLETFPAVMAVAGTALLAIDRAILALFVLELLLKLAAYGRGFFRSGWNWFDTIVVAIALAPSSGPLAVFRALRVLRILRLVSAIPKLRFMAETLVRSLPGLGSIGALLGIFFYVFGVVATKLFGAAFPAWFGSLWVSMFSLFQIMTLEGWADIARDVMTVYPAAWMFFVAFILVATFTVLNLFIGLIVKVMEEPATAPSVDATAQDVAALRLEITALRTELRSVSLAITRARAARKTTPERTRGPTVAARVDRPPPYA